MRNFEGQIPFFRAIDWQVNEYLQLSSITCHPLLWKRSALKLFGCFVLYHAIVYLSLFTYQYAAWKKGFVLKLCTYFVLSHTIFHLSSFTRQTVTMRKGLSWSFAHTLCCPIPFFIYLHLPVRPLLWKRVCPKTVHMLCVVPYHFSSISIYLSDRCYETGFTLKMCTCFMLSH